MSVEIHAFLTWARWFKSCGRSDIFFYLNYTTQTFAVLSGFQLVFFLNLYCRCLDL